MDDKLKRGVLAILNRKAGCTVSDRTESIIRQLYSLVQVQEELLKEKKNRETLG